MTFGIVPFLVMGASGRIGGALRRQSAALEQAGLRPIWQARKAAPGFLTWDILAEPCSKDAASGVILCLAGVVRGTDSALAQNKALALAACHAARDQGARHVFFASSAAVYAPADVPLGEEAKLAPSGAYGAAKLAMERAVLAEFGTKSTILRIGNVAGFDALLGGLTPKTPARLDPVAGQAGGPLRSYIGPISLARVLTKLAGLAAQGVALPKVLNIAAAPVFMGDLLDAAGAEWRFGAKNADVIPKLVLDIARLQSCIEMPDVAMDATGMVSEWRELAG